MKILIVKTSSLGDILHSYPVLSYLRGKFPNSQIDWVVEKPFLDLLQGHPWLNNIFTIDSRNWRKSPWKAHIRKEIIQASREIREENYDVVFDLQGNVKSGIITFLAKSQKKVGFSRNRVPEWPNLLFTNKKFNPTEGSNIRDDLLFLVQSYFEDQNSFIEKKMMLAISQKEEKWITDFLRNNTTPGKKLMMVSPGSAWENKQMNPKELEKLLKGVETKENSFFLFTWGNEKERTLATNLQKRFSDNSLVLEKLSLPLLQHMMAQVDLLLSMDSLPLHLCGTTLTPSYGVFGASLASKYNPKGKAFFQSSCPYNRKFSTRCPILRKCATGACMKDLKAADVLKEMY
jgi:heptosyltransferase I